MKLFKLIEIDLDKVRARVMQKSTESQRFIFNTRQRTALKKLYDLFEAGEFQKCLDHVNDKKAFPYNERDEYSEVEHIDTFVGDILSDMAHSNCYTEDQLRLRLKRNIETAERELRGGMLFLQCPLTVAAVKVLPPCEIK